MNCKLEKNDNGTFLVFNNEEDAEAASLILDMANIPWMCITSFNNFMNAIKLN